MLKPTLVAALALAAGVAAAEVSCPEGREITLVNGRIHTMDAANSVVSSVVIRNGKFTAVGSEGSFAPIGCRQLINLGGRVVTPGLVDNHNHILLLGLRPGYHTPLENAASCADLAAPFGCLEHIHLGGRVVTPGLVDNHNHILLLGLRPGYHTPLENAASFADIAAIYAQRIAQAPAGAFITTIGGFNPVQFTEKRLPTLAELDTIAPANPVYVQVSFTGPATTNSAGKAFFSARGVAVGADGSIAANTPTVAALNALRGVQTFEDKLRGTRDAMAYAASLGVTTHYDMGGFLIPGSPDHEDEFTFDGAASWDPYYAYDPILQLRRNDEMKVRVRIFFLSMDNSEANPILSRRLQNAFREYGNDWLRTAGLGEFITNWPLFGTVTTPSNYPAAVKKAAERGWIYQQHTLTSAEDDVAITQWEAINATLPVAPLHWSIAHAMTITPQNLARLKALGAGVALHGFRYLAGTTTAAGPPYRTVLDSGVKVGAGSDSAQISALNPWLMLYYMTTGKNSSGVLINGGQTLTRQEALRLYTRENGWFAKEEDKVGSIEVGKLADLVVLSGDYFSVGEDALKQLRSVLTIVGGRIVHDAGVVQKSTR